MASKIPAFSVCSINKSIEVLLAYKNSPSNESEQQLQDEIERHFILLNPDLSLLDVVDDNSEESEVAKAAERIFGAASIAPSTSSTSAKRWASKRVIREYCNAACDNSLRKEMMALWTRTNPVLSKLSSNLNSVERDASIALRLWLSDREDALSFLEALFNSVDEEKDGWHLTSMIGRTLLGHYQERNGIRSLRSNLPSNLMRSIMNLTSLIDATLAQAVPDPQFIGGEERTLSSDDLLKVSFAVSHRAKMSRILFQIYSRFQVSINNSGNIHEPGFLNALIDAGSQIDDVSEDSVRLFISERSLANDTLNAEDELSCLIALIREQSNCLWRSPDHSDGNPLFELCYTLSLTLCMALDFYVPKVDPDTITFFSHIVFGRYNCDLVRSAHVNKIFVLLELGKVVSSWKHRGVQSLVILSFSHWYSGLFRFKQPDYSDEVQIQAKEYVNDFIQYALDTPYKAIHMLSRVLTSPSFARLPSHIRVKFTLLVHHVCKELVGLACSDFPGICIKDIVFRTRMTPLATFGGAPRPAHLGVPALSDLPDCIEDILTLQAQLTRAIPHLSCRYWCLRGSATEPYNPPSLAGVDMRRIDRESGLDLLDPGWGIGVLQNQLEQPMYIVSQNRHLLQQPLMQLEDNQPLRHLDPTSYLKVIVKLVRDDLEDARHYRPKIDRNRGERNFTEMELVSGGGDIYIDNMENPSANVNSVRIKRAAVKSFLSLFADFLAALGSGPLCADGRSCPEHLALFLGRKEPNIVSAVGADELIQSSNNFSKDSCLSYPDGLVTILSLFNSELDNTQQSNREKRFERLRNEWEQSRNAHENDALRDVFNQRRTEEPRPPEIRRPPERVLQSILRIIQTLCLDDRVRDDLCERLVRLPERCVDGRFPDRSIPEQYFVSHMDVDFLDSDVPHTNLIDELLRLLPLGSGMSVKSKAAVMVALTRIAEGSPPYAALIRDGIESTSLLRTNSTIGPDIRLELETVATTDMTYDAAISFCELLRTIIAQVPMHSLGKGHRSPGIIPHLRFVIDDILLQHARRPVRPGSEVDRWKMAFGPLAILFDLIRSYVVNFPASKSASSAADVARRLNIHNISTSHQQQDDPIEIPEISRNKGLRGWILYAVQFREGPLTFQPMKDFINQFCNDSNHRIATLAEVCSFLSPVAPAARGGGCFRAWTRSDSTPVGQLCWYNSNTHPDNPVVVGITGHESSAIWFLFETSAAQPRFQGSEFFKILVEEAIQVSDDNISSYVPGHPQFDFCPHLPKLIVRSSGSLSSRTEIDAPRSASFEVMRQLLSGGDLFRCILSIIVQAGCEGPGSAEGAAGLELAHEVLDITSIQSISARHKSLRLEMKSSQDLFRSESLFRRMRAPDSLVTGNEKSLEELSKASEKVADEISSRNIISGMNAQPSACEDAVEWREKVLCLALSVLDAALSRDELFVQGARDPVRLPDSLFTLPTLLCRVPILPYILRAVAYKYDARISIVAARILYKLEAERSYELPAGTLSSEILQTSFSSSSDSQSLANGMSASELVETIAVNVFSSSLQNSNSWNDDRITQIEMMKKQHLVDPLLSACRKKQKGVALRLILRGADVEATDPIDGATPLLLACRNRLTTVASLLIEQGRANLDSVDCNNKGSLSEACNAGFSRDNLLLLRLLEYGANVNAKDDMENTLLLSTLIDVQKTLNSTLTTSGFANEDFFLEKRKFIAYLLHKNADIFVENLEGKSIQASIDWLHVWFRANRLQDGNQSSGWPSFETLQQTLDPEKRARLFDPDFDRNDVFKKIQQTRTFVRLPAPLLRPGVLVSGVCLPLSRLDGVYGTRSYSDGYGWATDRSEERDNNVKALSLRRSILLDLILRSIQQDISSSSLGHLLLGMHRSLSLKSRETTFSVMARSIQDINFVTSRHPKFTASSLSICHALLKSPLTAMQTVSFLEESLRNQRPIQEGGILMWAPGHHVLRANDDDTYTVLSQGDRDRRFRVRNLRTGATINSVDGYSLRSAFETQDKSLLSWLLSQLPFSVPFAINFIGDPSSSVTLRPGGCGSSDDFFSSLNQHEHSYKLSVSELLQCISSEIHLRASQPTEDVFIQLRSTCTTLLSSRPGEKSFVKRLLNWIMSLVQETLPEKTLLSQRKLSAAQNELSGTTFDDDNESPLCTMTLLYEGGPTISLWNVPIVRDLLLSRNIAQSNTSPMNRAEEPSHSQIHTTLEWSVKHNNAVNSLKSSGSLIFAFGQLLCTILTYVYPDPDVRVTSESLSREKQLAIQYDLLELLGELLDAILSGFVLQDEADKKGINFFLLIPLSEVVLLILHKIRVVCPSIRMQPNDIKRLAEELVHCIFASSIHLPESDESSCFRFRAFMYASLLELSHYSLCRQPLYDFNSNGSLLPSQVPQSILKSPRIVQGSHEECVLSWLHAIGSFKNLTGDNLAVLVAADCCNQSMSFRTLSFLLLATLVQPTISGSGITIGGVPHVEWVSVGGSSSDNSLLSASSLLILSQAQASLCTELSRNGCVSQLLVTLSSLDAVECNSGISLLAIGGDAGSESNLFTDKGISRTIDACFQTLSSIASSNRVGISSLLDCGLLLALLKLNWPKKIIAEFGDLRSKALGLRGSSSIENVVANAVAHIAPRLTSILNLVVVSLEAKPLDAVISSDILVWLSQNYVLFDLVVQATLASQTNLACIFLSRLFVDVLRRLASIPNLLSRPSSGNSQIVLDDSRADEIVLRLFQRYAPQPREPNVQRIVAEGKRSDALTAQHQEMFSDPSRRLKDILPQADEFLKSWLQAVSPSTLEERSWSSLSIGSKSALFIDSLVTNCFHVNVLLAGERLFYSLAGYCRVRCSGPLPSLLGSARSVAPVILFRSKDHVLGDALRLGSTPTINALVEAICHAGLAYEHAKNRLELATEVNTKTPHLPVEHSSIQVIGSPIPAEKISLESMTLALGTFENLLVVFLTHSLSSSELRFSSVVEVEKFQSRVRNACDASSFAAMIIERLKDAI